MKNTKFIKSILFVMLSWASLGEARDWEKINIPGALCGNGEPYSVFVDKKNAQKLLVEFMGGGACWSEETCYGDNQLTKITPLPGLPRTSTVAQEAEGNPWNEHTALYFPYCTGDVFAAYHVASYRPDLPLYHHGFTNVVMALQYLQQQNIINFKQVNDILLWGASAGALGALIHSETLDAYLDPAARRTLIADSPGLHFGKNFWHKFTPALNNDFKATLAKINLAYSVDDGFIAPRFGPVFLKLDRWHVGIMQSTQDMVMSALFGNITPMEHRKLVLGRQGIPMIARPYLNVKTWIMDGVLHTFLVKEKTSVLTDMKGETAWNFATRTYGFVLTK